MYTARAELPFFLASLAVDVHDGNRPAKGGSNVHTALEKGLGGHEPIDCVLIKPFAKPLLENSA